MFAIAFDLVVADAAQHHPRGVTAAYTDIGVTLKRFSFERIQESQHLCRMRATDMPRISSPPANSGVKPMTEPDLPTSFKNIRGFLHRKLERLHAHHQRHDPGLK